MRRTQGTETSKYLQEEKSIEIPKVAASEMGRAQTSHVPSPQALHDWGCGGGFEGVAEPSESYKTHS
jgi:hypothetical protein